MTYEKKLWVTGEKIEAHELNHIEDGLIALDAELDQSPSFEDLENAVKDKVDTQALESLKTEVAQKADQATTYTKTEVDNLVQSLVHYKGTVQTQAELPTKAKEGDFYFVVETSSFWGYSGTTWTNTEAFINLSAYATKAEIEAEYAKITQIPTALPNPEKLEIVFNGTVLGDYVGSEKKTIIIDATLDRFY